MNFNKKDFYTNEISLALGMLEKQPDNLSHYDRIINAYIKLGNTRKALSFEKIKESKQANESTNTN